uniref:Uncharacterized protein n=1 Tax=Rhizophora mucronata TaxID=61149 RepID=A0A2P2PTM8_RHIMU
MTVMVMLLNNSFLPDISTWGDNSTLISSYILLIHNCKLSI